MDVERKTGDLPGKSNANMSFVRIGAVSYTEANEPTFPSMGGFMEKQDISNPNIDWASLVRHVAKDQVTIELADGTVAIAQVIPIKKSVAMKDFAAMMNSLPSLGKDAESFARDVEATRSSFKEESDPWES